MTPSADEDTPGVRRAWGWVAHLLDGGTTPWRDWTQEGRPGGRILPGAQQLELLRRLNTAGSPSVELAVRVLDASAPGRGRPDLELEGAVERLAFGPPPVDPGGLRDDELIRVAVSVLADDVVTAGPPEPRRVPPGRPWRTRYRLVGDPLLADPRRADLIGRGRPPGGRGSVVLVLGTDLGQMLVDAWTARSLAEGGPSWREWIDRAARGPGVPARVDLPRIARVWTDRVGAGRVRVVLDPAAVPGLIGVRRPLAAAPALSADAVDLARRVGQVLGLLASPTEREVLLRERLTPLLAPLGGASLVVPPEHGRWLRTRAERMHEALLRGGYPVHGDPDTLLPVDRDGVAAPVDAGVLALAMRLMLERED